MKCEDHKSHKEHADKLKDRLKYAYKKATEGAQKKGQYKHYYDQKGILISKLETGGESRNQGNAQIG